MDHSTTALIARAMATARDRLIEHGNHISSLEREDEKQTMAFSWFFFHQLSNKHRGLLQLIADREVSQAYLIGVAYCLFVFQQH